MPFFMPHKHHVLDRLVPNTMLGFLERKREELKEMMSFWRKERKYIFPDLK